MPSRHSTRAAVSFAGLGLLALTGCANGTADPGGNAGTGNDADTSAEYADGSYTATGEYTAPSGRESIEVEITLEDDIVTAVTVTPHATEGNPKQFQGQFAGGIEAVVVGKDIDSLDVSRVAGSSLTSGGFNDALEQIKAEALES